MQWGGAALPTTFVSPTQLLAVVASAQISIPLNAAVTVLTARGPSPAASFIVRGSYGAQVTIARVTKTPPGNSGCVTPPAVTNFSTANLVYLYFQARVATTDALLDWAMPNGTVVDAGSFWHGVRELLFSV